MTGAKNKNVANFMYMGDTMEELWEEFNTDLKNKVVDEEKIIRVFIDWGSDNTFWTMFVYVSTYANKK